MARRRDFSAENAAREARARALGFESDYQRRIRGGRDASPSTPAFTGEQRAQAAGHRSRADLLRQLGPGDLVSVVSVDRDDRGRYKRIVVSVIDQDGREREYLLRGKGQLSDAAIASLTAGVDAAGAIQSPVYPLRGYYEHDDLDDVELDEDLGELEAELEAEEGAA